MIFKSSSGLYNACNFSGSMSRRCNHVSHLDAGGFLTKVYTRQIMKEEDFFMKNSTGQ